jgi:hypothetical protein
MSPPSTAAARRSSARSGRGGHPPGASSRAPARRMSGPARGRPVAATAGAGGRPVALPRPRAALPRLGARLRGLPDHRLLHRLIGGRAWIPLLAVALLGIVALQVSMLQLNSQIGRSVTRESDLERQNAALRAGNARLSDEQRLRQLAGQAGLINPGTGSIRFLRVGGGDARRAVAQMKAPLFASSSTSGTGITSTTPTTTPTSTVPLNTVASVTPTTPTSSAPPTTSAPPPTSSTAATVAPPATTPAPTATTQAPSTTTQAPATTQAPTTTTPGASVTGTPTSVPPVATTGGAGTP